MLYCHACHVLASLHANLPGHGRELVETRNLNIVNMAYNKWKQLKVFTIIYLSIITDANASL